MRYYVTKYALTEGIKEEECLETSGGWVRTATFQYFRPGRNAFLTREEAEAAAIAMAKRKLESLHKQMAKVSKLAAEPKWARGK